MRVIIISSVVLLLTGLISIESKAENFPTDVVYDTGKGIPQNFRHFTQVMGSEKLEFALIRYECFRKTNPQIPVALMVFPVPFLTKIKNDAPGYPRPRFPYSIVVASYATALEANEALSTTRQKIKLNALFECLKFKKSDENKEAFNNQFYTYQLRVAPDTWPRIYKRSPMTGFDGISLNRKTYQASREAPAVMNAVVKNKIYTDIRQVQAELSGIQSLYPELHFAALQQGEYYYLSPAANTNKDVLAEAILQMRRRGLYEYTYSTTISSEVNLYQAPPLLQGLPGQKTEFELVPAIKLQSSIKQIAILDIDDLVSPVQERVASCIKKLKPPEVTADIAVDENEPIGIGPGIPLDKFASCSGVILDREGMTRCLFNSDCAGIRVPINWDVNPVDIAKNCILVPDSTCAGTTLDPIYTETLRNAHIEKCFGAPESIECSEIKFKLSNICQDQQNQNLCEVSADLAKSIEMRTSELMRCVSFGHCQHIILRPPGIEETIKKELYAVKDSYEERIYPVKEGLAFLSKNAKDLASELNDCKKQAETDKLKSADCFAKLALSPTELQALECFRKADKADKAKCFIKDHKVQEVVDTAQCLNSSDGNPGEIAKCAGLEELAEIEEKYQCVSNESSTLNAIGKCSNLIPRATTEAITCISDSGGSPELLANCIPGHTKESKAVTCLSASKTDSERAGCLIGAIPMGPNARKAFSCIATSNGDSQEAARCSVAGILPGDLGKAVACGSTSTGSVDFALCVAGPQMNAELRMAAQCAATTGGEPFSFATCTAGTLTVAELTKCMSGEIGREGGCFGPNNTIVVVLKNAFNDMNTGLGDNNEMVKAYKEIENVGEQINDFVTDVGREVGNVIEDSLIRPFRCIFGC